VGDQARREQLAEVPVIAGARGGDDQNVPWLRLLDRDVYRPVVAGRHLAGQSIARDANRPVDRPQAGGEKSGATLGLVDGRHTEFTEGVDQFQVSPFRVADNYSHQSLQEVHGGALRSAAPIFQCVMV